MSRGFEDYSETILDHFENPRNVGDVDCPDAEATVRSPVHGDRVKLTFRICAGKIVEVRFRALGCPVTIAAASMATVLLRNRTIQQALALRDEEVARALGGIPEERLLCSVLVERAVKEALGAASAGGPPAPGNP
jgi:nitrogen fixation NifU-like protein